MYRKHPNHTYGRNRNNSASNRVSVVSIALHFNGKKANFISKPQKVIESRTYDKKSQSEVLLKQFWYENLKIANF